MRWFAIVAAFGVGLVSGAGVFAVNGATVAGAPKSAVDMQKLSTSELGGLLMSRVGQRFIRDSRREYPVHAGVAFFDIPKPYLGSLCRVDRFEVSPNMVKDQRVRDNHYWDDNLKIERFYFAWKGLETPDGTAADREKGCAKHKDFENLLNEETPYSAGRAFELMNTATAQARINDIAFSLSCNGAADNACRALLRSINLKALRHVETISQVEGYQEMVFTDVITVVRPEMSPGRWTLRLTARSRTSTARGFEILALNIEELPPFYTPTAPLKTRAE
jgi:hypothetical protein